MAHLLKRFELCAHEVSFLQKVQGCPLNRDGGAWLGTLAQGPNLCSSSPATSLGKFTCSPSNLPVPKHGKSKISDWGLELPEPSVADLCSSG